MQIRFKLISNFFFLAVGQGSTFLVPLLLAPYLIKIVGLGNYGLIVSAQAIMSYFSVFTDYGFNLTAVKDCSINRDNSKKLDIIIAEVLVTKIILLLIATLILFIIYSFFPKPLLLLSYAIVVGKVVSPNWFFQGVEKMYLLTIFSVLSKLFSTLLIILYINSTQDYIWVNFLLGLGDILFGCFGFIYIYTCIKLSPIIPSFKGISLQIYEGFAILVTNFANNIYLNSNIIILGFYVSPQILGIYALAEKIMVTVKQVAVVLLQATYSHACYLAEVSLDSLKAFLRRELLFMGSFFLFLSFILIAFDKIIVSLFVKNDIDKIAHYVSILSVVPLIVSLNMPAYKMLVIQNLKKGYLLVVSTGAFLNILLNFFLVYLFQEKGTIATIIVTELLITFGFYIYLWNDRRYKFI